MSLKKFDLAKNLGLKVAGQMKAAGVPNRFAQGANELLDKRERRARDAALGLVPFACKLPSELVKRLNERGATHEGGVNALLAELLSQALDGADAPATPAPRKPAAKKVAAKEVAEKTGAEKTVAAKKVAAKKAVAKSAAAKGSAQP